MGTVAINDTVGIDMTTTRFVRASLGAMVCVAAFVAAAVPASAAPASTAGGVLTVSPAHPDPAVTVGKSYFVHSVVPGASWTDEVAVANTNDTAVDAWIDPVDGVTSVRTGAVYSARTVPIRGAGAWLHPSVPFITVAPHAEGLVAFTVHVPAGASVGDHVAGIAFESKTGTTSSGSVAITTVLRSVVAVQITVPGPADFQLHLYSATVRAVSTTGTSGIALDMANDGGLLGKPQLEITLDGPARYHRTESLELDTMLPGDRIVDELLWPDTLGAGDYRVSIIEDGSGRHGSAFVTTAHLAAALVPTVPGQIPASAPSPTNNGIPALVLVGGLAVGLASVVLGVLLVARRRRRRCLHCHRSLRLPA